MTWDAFDCLREEFMQKIGKTVSVVAVLTFCVFSTAWAQPRQILNPLRNIGDSIRNANRTVEADPNKEYRLTEAEGPYLILAAALSGPTARKDAHDLALEFRSRYRWNAYVFEKNFTRDANRDFGQVRNSHSRMTLQYSNRGETQFVVLIGNFPSLEDNQFKRTLEEVRRSQPESLKGRTSVAAFSLPMAFGLANPSLPPEHQRGTVDAFVEALNKNRPRSLLQNPRRYTVHIATFSGRAVMDPKDIRAIEEGRNSFDQQVSALEIGEQAAAKLCQILHARGIEAYEFHDRSASIVTVGSFDQPGRQMPDGTMVPDPRIQQIIQQFQGQVIDGIQCSPQPRLIEVPRVARR